ncbi:MAG: archaeosortase/exosortase family protein [Phycisphaerales bacterium]|nr:archaeosortase/exosortase family protein [Phycisphaerales bacterium]
MSRKSKRSTKRAAKVAKRQTRAPRRKSEQATGPSWFHAKRPVLRFVSFFGITMATFFVCSTTDFAKQQAWPAYLGWNAQVSASLLTLLGQDVAFQNRTVMSPKGWLLIEQGCDAVQPSAMFIAAILAFPASVRAKVIGIIGGVLLLAMTNLVRIISLFFVQLHYPRFFDLMHIEVWQVAFITLAVALWAMWIRWSGRFRQAVQYVGA